MIDLYPNESWSFVFGQAKPAAGVGVFSFARYDPLFYESHSVAGASTCTSPLVLWRSCKVCPSSHSFFPTLHPPPSLGPCREKKES